MKPEIAGAGLDYCGLDKLKNRIDTVRNVYLNRIEYAIALEPSRHIKILDDCKLE